MVAPNVTNEPSEYGMEVMEKHPHPDTLSSLQSLLIGDYLLVDKMRYGGAGPWDWIMPYRQVRRGDVIVFRYPVHPTQHFVKRVVGLPGDRVRLINRRVYVNGNVLQEPYARYTSSSHDAFRDEFPR